jgi:uncharacterized protein YggE
MSIRRSKGTVPGAVLLAAVVAAGCAGQAGAADSADATRTVRVTGVGQVSQKPDTMSLDIGVVTRGPSARAALGANSERAGRAIDALKAAGVAADDLQTANLSVNPVWDQKGQRIVSYEASNFVHAKLHALDRAGAVIDAAAGQAGDDVRFGGISFSIENTGKLMAAARKDAMRSAAAQARELATAGGAHVGAVRRITVRTDTGPKAASPSFAADALRATPVETGTQELTVSVDVEYTLR